jgi:hypothetical protein
MKEDSLMRKWKWQKRGRPKELYFDVTCVDAPVLPELPVPMCDCGKPAGIDQSYYEDTAARAYYCCNDYRVSALITCVMCIVAYGTYDDDYFERRIGRHAISSNGSMVPKKKILGFFYFLSCERQSRMRHSDVGSRLHRTLH